MIVRIAGEGQYRVDSGVLDRVHDLDNRLMAAVAGGETEGLHSLLEEMARIVRSQGHPVPAQEIVESDLVMPAPDSSLEEVRTLFQAGERAL